MTFAEITDPEWLAILVPALIAAVGGAYRLRSNRRKRFLPRIDARLDGPRQAIRLNIKNEGEIRGSINEVGVVDVTWLEAEFPCYEDLRFRRTPLAGGDEIRLVIHAPRPTPFPDEIRLDVRWSGGGRTIAPEHMQQERYYNLEPQLPWRCRREADGSWRRGEQHAA